MELLLERNKELYMDYFKIDTKKFLFRRLMVGVIFLVLFILIYMVTSNVWVLVGMPFIALFGYKLPYLELINQKNKQDIVKQYMFPTFLRYFISLLDTQGNVYQTLKATVPYVNDPIKTELIKLIVKLEKQNVNNRDAFMDFAEYIGSSEAHMVLSIIYQFNEEGINKDDISELENTIRQLQENKTNELIEHKVNSIDKHANPLLIYALAYILGFAVLVFISYFQTIEF